MRNLFIGILVLLVIFLGMELQDKYTQSDSVSPNAVEAYNIESKIAELTNLPVVDLKALAESGDSRSQVALADIYYIGEGVDKNVSAARELYRQASVQGSDIAVARLVKRFGANSLEDPAPLPNKLLKGEENALPSTRNSLLVSNPLPKDSVAKLYSDGISLVSQDNGSALSFLQKAAENGHAEAQFYVGVAYLRGFGAQVDVERGRRWLIHAAENGTANAKYKLGMMYKNGLLLKRDAVLAERWILQAKAAGFSVDSNQISSDSNAIVPTKTPQSVETTRQRVEESKQAARSDSSETESVQRQEWLTERTQFYLSVVGLYFGPKDGVFNESLEQAIYRFQTKHRISADGKVSEKLLSRIKQTL